MYDCEPIVMKTITGNFLKWHMEYITNPHTINSIVENWNPFLVDPE
jgi:hypothetical protein